MPDMVLLSLLVLSFLIPAPLTTAIIVLVRPAPFAFISGGLLFSVATSVNIGLIFYTAQIHPSWSGPVVIVYVPAIIWSVFWLAYAAEIKEKSNL